jgi:hypothetical protein
MTRPIRPDLQDFDEVKRDYCRSITLTSLNSMQGLKATIGLRRSCIGWRKRPSSID